MPLPATLHPSMAQRQQKELQLVQDLQRELKAVQDLANNSSSYMEQVTPSQIDLQATVITQAPIGIPAPTQVLVEGSITLEECAVEMQQHEGLYAFTEVRFKPRLVMDCGDPTILLHTTHNHLKYPMLRLLIYR
jgi:hypothetical protein